MTKRTKTQKTLMVKEAPPPASPPEGSLHVLPGGDAIVTQFPGKRPQVEMRMSDGLKAMGGSDRPPFNSVLLRETIETVHMPPGAHDTGALRIAAVGAALAAFKPADEIEGMLAAQAVALHFGAMECLRRAMLFDQPADIAR